MRARARVRAAFARSCSRRRRCSSTDTGTDEIIAALAREARALAHSQSRRLPARPPVRPPGVVALSSLARVAKVIRGRSRDGDDVGAAAVAAAAAAAAATAATRAANLRSSSSSFSRAFFDRGASMRVFASFRRHDRSQFAAAAAALAAVAVCMRRVMTVAVIGTRLRAAGADQ